MKPHIARYFHSDINIWVWGVWLGGYLACYLQKWKNPNYTCTQLSIVKDIQRGLLALVEIPRQGERR